MKTIWNPLLLGVVATLASVASAPAQRHDPLKLIDFHVTTARRNASFSATEHEGVKFNLTLNDTRQSYALSLVQRAGTRFAVTVFRRNIAGADTSFTALETVRATLGRPAALAALPDFTVVVDGVRRANTRISTLPAGVAGPASSSHARSAVDEAQG